MRALPTWPKGFLYASLCIFALVQTGFGQGPAAASAYGKLPLSFEPNQGQTAGEVQFLSRGRGYTLFLSSSDSVQALHRRHRGSRAERMEAGPTADAPAALRMHLVGANPSAQGIAEDALPGKSNYFIGNDRTKWRTNVPNYGRVRYRGVYPGIDLVYYGNQRLLEHDFEVAPGADPRKIRLAFEGTNGAEIAPSGDLVLHVADGEVRLQKPVIYQNTEEGRREVTGGFVLSKKQEISIRVGDYDRRRTLVIDPILSYSTYLGGTGEDFGTSVAVDGSGNIYLTGYTASTVFPGIGTGTGVISTTCQSCGGHSDDVFILKLNSAFQVVYGTYIGGSNDDESYSIAVDSSGNAYVTGFTNSSTFPITTSVAYQKSLLSTMGNAFVTEVNTTGNGLLLSTYLGGTARDYGEAITVDSGATPNIYVTGTAYSTDFPAINRITTPPTPFYASTTGGTSWSPATGITSLDIKAIAVDLGTPGTVYAGAQGGGVYKSTNADQSTPIFTQTSLNDYVNALVIDPLTTGTSATLYAASRFFGVQRSLSNGGSSWSQINNSGSSGLGNLNVLSLALQNSSTLFAGTNGSGVYMSTNADTATPSWSQVTLTGLGNRTINALVVTSTGTLYAGTNDGVYQLVAPGVSTTWNSFNNGLPANSQIAAVALDASSNVYAGTFGSPTFGALYKAASPGSTWTSISGSGGTKLPLSLVRAIAFDSTTIYAGGRVGLYKSTDGGATWTSANSGLTINSVDSVAVGGTGVVYAGMINHMSFVAKFLNSGGAPTYVSPFGGMSGVTTTSAVAADASGNMYIGGWTVSDSIPGPVVIGSSHAGPNYDGFVSKINTSGAVVWDRYLGSPESDDFITGVGVDSSNVYVTGYTAGTFPVTPTAYQSTLSGPVGVADDVFLTKLDSTTGTNLLYSTYFGGTSDDLAYSLALFGNTGQVAIAGESTSLDIPGGNGVQPLNLDGDTALYAQFDTTKSGAASLVNWSFLGGSTGFEFANSVAVDSSKNVYLTGATWSTDFPFTSNAIQTTLSSAPDAFFAKIISNGNTSDLALTMTTNAPATLFSGEGYIYTLTVKNNGSSPQPLASSVQVFDLLPGNVTLSSTPARRKEPVQEIPSPAPRSFAVWGRWPRAPRQPSRSP